MVCRVSFLLCLFLLLTTVHPSLSFKLVRSSNRTTRLPQKILPWIAKKWLTATAVPLVKLTTKVYFTIHPSKLAARNETALPPHPEAKMTTVEIISSRGYPVETHSVITQDGYVLELHRIPYGKNRAADSTNLRGKPVLIQHGFIGSSADFLIGPSDRALAFQLADRGYDVWLGNSRGNTYSRKHVHLDPSQVAFWDFSMDEMGKYDIPAVINFIRASSGRDKLIYIGYSMGVCTFFIAMITHPELNSKIEIMIAMGPAVSMAHVSSPIFRSLAPAVRGFEFMHWLLRTGKYLGEDMPMRELRSKYCVKNYAQVAFCRRVLFKIVGDSIGHFDMNWWPVIDGHMPAGTSVRTWAHFGTNHNSGQTFNPYDYGFLGNLRHYGKLRPTPYDLTKVVVPIYLFYGTNDLLVQSQDVDWLLQQLPNVKEAIQVDNKYYNHFDFLWSSDNNRLVYNKIFTVLPPP